MAELTVCGVCGKEAASVFVLVKRGDSAREETLCLRCAEKRKVPSVKEYVRRQKKARSAVQMCEKCGELPALVAVSTAQDGTEQEKRAFCGFCARELKIPQVEEMLAQMEISDEEFRQLHEKLLRETQAPQGILQRLKTMLKG